MPVGVVDGLELVEVHQHHSEARARPLQILFGTQQPGIESAAVGEPGERILLRHVLQGRHHTAGHHLDRDDGDDRAHQHAEGEQRLQLEKRRHDRREGLGHHGADGKGAGVVQRDDLDPVAGAVGVAGGERPLVLGVPADAVHGDGHGQGTRVDDVVGFGIVGEESHLQLRHARELLGAGVRDPEGQVDVRHGHGCPYRHLDPVVQHGLAVFPVHGAHVAARFADACHQQLQPVVQRRVPLAQEPGHGRARPQRAVQVREHDQFGAGPRQLVVERRLHRVPVGLVEDDVLQAVVPGDQLGGHPPGFAPHRGRVLEGLRARLQCGIHAVHGDPPVGKMQEDEGHHLGGDHRQCKQGQEAARRIGWQEIPLHACSSCAMRGQARSLGRAGARRWCPA